VHPGHIPETPPEAQYRYGFCHEKGQTLLRRREFVAAREFVGRPGDKKIRLHKMVYARSYYTTLGA
jgi:hypothetical protein